jgi:hypothetical protein
VLSSTLHLPKPDSRLLIGKQPHGLTDAVYPARPGHNCVRERDARSTTVVCGFEFRDAESGGEFGIVPHREFHRRAGTRLSKVWGSFVSGAAMFRFLMSRKVWLTVRRGVEVGPVEKVEALECGVQVL